MSICILLGTRAEIIKMAPIIRECQARSVNFFVLHTGQHYDTNMDREFFDELGLPAPRYNLNVGSHPHRKQVGLMIKAITTVLMEEKPSWVIVQGDTTSVLAGALSASKLGIPVAHHEAGLRSHDPTMLEETNRVITDHVSDRLFAPTPTAVSNLNEEGYSPDKIFYTGNTVVDAINQHRGLANQSSKILSQVGVESKQYFFMTVHRAENVDHSDRLRGILYGLQLIHQAVGLPIIWPIHPRTKKNLTKFGLHTPPGVRCIEPVGYLDSLHLQSQARLSVTDSGGIQEESCVLGTPCVTVRDNTERPETIDIVANVLVGADPHTILAGVRKMLAQTRPWPNPFGDGKAAQRIVAQLAQSISKTTRSV